MPLMKPLRGVGPRRCVAWLSCLPHLLLRLPTSATHSSRVVLCELSSRRWWSPRMEAVHVQDGQHLPRRCVRRHGLLAGGVGLGGAGGGCLGLRA